MRHLLPHVTLSIEAAGSRPLTIGQAVEVREDRQVVDAVLAGDRSAYAVLVDRYERGVLATTLSVLKNDRHLAWDAAQNALVNAYQNLGRLRDRAAFGAWLLTIARREAARLAKRQGSNEPLNGDHAAPGDLKLDELSEYVIAATAALPEHERVVVMLRYFEEHDVQTIAAMLGRPVGTVTKQLSRAHDRLRVHLRERGLP